MATLKEKFISSLPGLKQKALYIAFTALGASSPSMWNYFTDQIDDEKNITVSIGKDEWRAFENGNGHPADLYVSFARAIDADVTRGGRSAKVTIETETDTTVVRHIGAVAKPGVIVTSSRYAWPAGK